MPLSIGIIGTGSMAEHHAKRLGAVPGVRLTACCDVSEERAAAFAAANSIRRVYTDYRHMLEKEALDGVSVAAPDAAHAEISIAALGRSIGVLCEKPLAVNVRQAQAMADEASRAGVPNMVNFSKRDSCGLQAVRRLIEGGKIGRVMHMEASYLQSWLVDDYWGDWRREHRWLWRMSTNHGSTGVLGDLGCHIYDMADFLCGEFSGLYCTERTFEKGPYKVKGDYDLKANDSFSSTISFRSGALGSIHSSRWATGHKNREYICVFGDKGAVKIDFEISQDAYFRHAKAADNDWTRVECKKTPSMYERFVKALKTGKNDECDFAQGLKIQRYLEASLRSSKTGRAVALPGSRIEQNG